MLSSCPAPRKCRIRERPAPVRRVPASMVALLELTVSSCRDRSSKARSRHRSTSTGVCCGRDRSAGASESESERVLVVGVGSRSCSGSDYLVTRAIWNVKEHKPHFVARHRVVKSSTTDIAIFDDALSCQRRHSWLDLCAWSALRGEIAVDDQPAESRRPFRAPAPRALACGE